MAKKTVKSNKYVWIANSDFEGTTGTNSFTVYRKLPAAMRKTMRKTLLVEIPD